MRRSNAGTLYVRLHEVSEPARLHFAEYVRESTRPRVAEDPFPCAYWHQWLTFLEG
jgi:hypothetical protein